MSSAETVWICPLCGTPDGEGKPGARCAIDSRVLVPEKIRQQFPDDDLLGRVLVGKYALYSVLGKGGFGAVYKALQEPVNRPVAVKCIRPEIAHRPGVRERFFREAQVVARINHPGAVTLFDYGEDEDGSLYMVFELLQGRPLSTVLRKHGGPMGPRRAARIARDLLEALAEAHAQGAIHRDLKPENVMILPGRNGEEHVKILDFGIAKVRSTDGDPNALTGADIVLGTPLYMAPEQATAGPIDPRADLYAIGVILFLMLTGQPPYEGATPFETLLAHREKPIPQIPSALGVPPDLVAVVHRALQKYPADRFADAQEMARALASVLDGPVLQPTTTLAEVEPEAPHVPEGDGTTSREWRGQVAAAPAQPAGGGRRFPLVAAVAALVAGGGVAAWLALSGPAEVTPDAGPAEPVAIKMGGGPATPKTAPASRAPASKSPPSAAPSAPASKPASVPPSAPASVAPGPFAEVEALLAQGKTAEAASRLVALAKADGKPGFWKRAEAVEALAPALLHATVQEARKPTKVARPDKPRKPARRPATRAYRPRHPARRPATKAPAIDVPEF